MSEKAKKRSVILGEKEGKFYAVYKPPLKPKRFDKATSPHFPIFDIMNKGNNISCLVYEIGTFGGDIETSRAKFISFQDKVAHRVGGKVLDTITNPPNGNVEHS